MKTRIVDFRANQFKGDLARDTKTGVWFFCCPTCGVSGPLGDHLVTVEGESVTVTPSFICHQSNCGAWYHIKNSEISKV